MPMLDAAKAMEQVKMVGQQQAPAQPQQPMQQGQGQVQTPIPEEPMHSQPPQGAPMNANMSDLESLNEEMEYKYGDPADDSEQEMYDAFMDRATDFLYQPNKMEQLIAALSMGKQNAAQAMGDKVAQLVSVVDDDLGGNFPRELLLPAANELTELMADLVQEKDVMPVNNKVVNTAAQYANSKLMEIYEMEEFEMQELGNSLEGQDVQRVAQMASGFYG